MSQLADRLSSRTAELSYLPVASGRDRLALSSTYYNGSTLHAAGTTTASASDRMAKISERSNANNERVASILSGRIQAKKVQTALEAAQQREKAANDAIAGAKDSYNIPKPTKPTNDPYIHPITKPRPPAPKGKGKGKQYADDRRTVGGVSYSGKIEVVDSKGYGNTSGASGAIGGKRGSGTYKYVNNTRLSYSRNKLLRTATNYLGTRYVLGGESHSGIDCSGLVQLVYRQMGFRVPTHSAADQGQTGGRRNGNGIPGVRTSFNNLRPGDLVAWKDGSHIAIYAGNGNIIEAANPTRGTILRPLWASTSAVIGIRVTLPGEGSKPKKKSYADDHRR